MKRTFLPLFAVALSACATAASLPAFNLRATNGGVVSNAILAKRPTLLVFLKIDCPMNPRQIPNLNALAKSLGKSMDLIGVVNGNLADASAFAKREKIAFPLVADAKEVLIGGVGAKHSLDFTALKGGKYDKVWRGVSTGQLQEALAKLGRPKATLTGFPAKPAGGCSF